MKQNKTQHTRFSAAPWFTEEEIIVGGAGGISSWLVNLLARIGHTLYVYDMDTVEESNIGGQLYAYKDVGKAKTEATADMVSLLSNHEINAMNLMYDENSMASPIMFAGFDNMKARKAMFENWEKQENRELFVDGRLLMENGQIFIVQKGQEAGYRKTLFKDEDVEDADCTMKASSHSAALIASLMVSALNNYLTVRETEQVRTVPFKVEFILPMFYITATTYDKDNQS